MWHRSNSLSEIWHMLFVWWNMSFDYIISEICNSMIEEVILIGDSTTLLDYGHRFIGSLHAVDSRSWTRALSYCYLHKVLKYSWFSLMECYLLQNWIKRESILLWFLVVTSLNSYTMMTQFTRVRLGLGSLLWVRAFW